MEGTGNRSSETIAVQVETQAVTPGPAPGILQDGPRHKGHPQRFTVEGIHLRSRPAGPAIFAPENHQGWQNVPVFAQVQGSPRRRSLSSPRDGPNSFGPALFCPQRGKYNSSKRNRCCGGEERLKRRCIVQYLATCMHERPPDWTGLDWTSGLDWTGLDWIGIMTSGST